jgi:predicted metal-dependent hydrolase
MGEEKRGVSMKQIILDGIIIEVTKKKIKNMYLRVLPPEGSVHVSAPVRMSDEAIKKFVLSKEDWILTQKTKLQKRHSNEILDYVSGEKINLWGKKYILKIVPSGKTDTGKLVNDSLILQVRPESTGEQRKIILNKFYREALTAEIPSLIEKWEKIIGVKTQSFSIRDMKTRWGTCHLRKKHICLNLQLAKKDSKCLEYVVVHELVHLLEGSHNRIFKGYMDQFLPGWRQIKQEMNGAE